MSRTATTLFLKYVLFVLITAFTAVPTLRAQGTLTLSRNADFSTDDRTFEADETIHIRVQTSGLDFSGLTANTFRLQSRVEGREYKGRFENHFNGTFTAAIPLAEIGIEEQLWAWEGRLEDAAGHAFHTRVFLRIGDPTDLNVVEIRAVVDEIGAGHLVLKGQRVEVTQQTRIVSRPHHEDGRPNDGEEVPVSLDDIEVGFMVRVRAATNAESALTAQIVEVFGPVELPRYVKLSGTIQSVDEGSFTVRGKRVVLGPETGIGGSGVQNGDGPRVGQLVTVYGDFQDNGSIQAHFVEVHRAERDELEVKGRIAQLTESTIVVNGVSFTLTENTRVETDPQPGEGPVDGEPVDGEGPGGGPEPGTDPTGPIPTEPIELGLEDLEVGLLVRVVGVRGSNGGLTAEWIRLESAFNRGVRLAGEAEAITETGFTVLGWDVEVHEHTEFVNEAFEQVSFGDLEAGQLVQVHGDLQEGARIVAHRVEYRRPERDEFGLRGLITALSAEEVRVWDVPFELTEATTVHRGPDGAGSVADLEVGLFVDIVGLPSAEGGLVAEHINVPDGAGGHVRLRGEVEALADNGLTIQGWFVEFDEHTFVHDARHEPVDRAEIEVGDVVEVNGSFRGEGIVAHDVGLRDGGDELELSGQIEAISGDLVTVRGLTFLYTQNSYLFSERDGEIAFGDLAVGGFVNVVAHVEDGGQLVIDNLHLKDQEYVHVRISGEIVSVDPGGLELWGWDVVFGPETQVFDPNYMPVPFEVLEVGRTVFVFGRLQEDGTILAEGIELKEAEGTELTLWGKIESVSASTVVVGNTAFVLTDHTLVLRPDEEGTFEEPGAPAAYGGLQVEPFDLEAGQDVEVVGKWDEAGVLTAAVIRIEGDEDKVRVSGAIEEVDGDRFVVMGWSVWLEPGAQVWGPDFEPLAPSDLTAGLEVEAWGRLLDDGSIGAFQVEVREGVAEEVEFNGEIDDLQSDLVVVEGTPFVLTGATMYHGDEGEWTLGDLTVGMEVFITGVLSDTGVLTALRLHVPADDVEARLLGPITALNGVSFDLLGRTVVTSDQTQFWNDLYEPILFADLALEQMVMVQGKLEDDGSVAAYQVQVTGTFPEEVEVWGRLASVDGDLLEVGGLTFILQENTHLSTDTGEAISLADLEAGQQVGITGRAHETGSLAAVRIHVATGDQDADVHLRGTVAGVGVDAFEVAGRTVEVDEETEYYGFNFEPASFEIVEAGRTVHVWGRMGADGSIVAYRVELDRRGQAEVEFTAPIEAIDGNVLVLRGLSFQVDEETRIEDRIGNALPLEELAVGQVVFVHGTPEAEAYRAWRIQIGGGHEDRGAHMSGVLVSIDAEVGRLVIRDRTVYFDEFTGVFGRSFEPIRATELAVGDGVRVFGQYNDDGTIRAHHIEVRGGGNHELELQGPIDAIQNGGVVVRGIAFAVTPNTHIDNGRGGTQRLSDLSVGQVVGISGRPDEAGAYVAVWIFTGETQVSEVRVSGTIASLNAEQRTLVVQGRPIRLHQDAQVVGPNYDRVTFDALKVGVFVNAFGELQADGSVVCYWLELRLPERQEFELAGTVAGLNEDEVTVHGITFQINDRTRIALEDQMRGGVDNLATGQIVHVRGVLAASNAFVAEHVEIFGLDPRLILEVEGRLTARTTQNLTVGGLVFGVNSRTGVVDGNGRPSTLTAAEIGTRVGVEALVTSTARVARRVELIEVINEERVFAGRIAQLGNDEFRVENVVFDVTDRTVFFDPFGNEMTFDDLEVRWRVEVEAVAGTGGSLVAQTVEVKPHRRKLVGTVEVFDGQTLVVAGIPVPLGFETEYVEGDDVPLDPSRIVPGLTVEVIIGLGEGGLPVAFRVRLLPRIEDEVVFTGPVQEKGDGELVVLGRTVHAVPNTRYLAPDRSPTTFAALAVGDRVKVRALLLAGGELAALQIRQLEDQNTTVRISGPVESVSASTLEVLGIFFFLNAETEVFGIGGVAAAPSDLVVGQNVAVAAEVQSDGTLVATQVAVESVALASGELPDLAGVESFELFGNTYRVDENTLVLGPGNQHLELSDLEPGQFVDIRGVVGVGGAGKVSSATIVASKIKVIDEEGAGEIEPVVDPEGNEPTGVEGDELPDAFTLDQNYPNPFNPETTIRFTLPQRTEMTLTIYDVLGREVLTLVEGPIAAGAHEIRWDGRNRAGLPVASGLYLYRLQAGRINLTRQMVLVK